MSTPPPPDDLMERQIGHLLRRAYVVARKNTAEVLAAFAMISPVQASAIATLANGAISQAELARRIDMAPANTHGLVKRLEAAGLVVLQRAPRTVALTGSGEALAAQIAASLAQSTAATLAPLDPDERAQLFALLRRVANATPQ